MRLSKFQNLNNYLFYFLFEDGFEIETNIKDVVAEKVDVILLNSARIDMDWGCLEFDNGQIDIEPKTLYQYCKRKQTGN